MSSRPSAKRTLRRSWAVSLRAARKLAATLLRRTYAVLMIALILWTSYRAIRYLLSSLVTPAASPRQIIGVPRRLDEALLHEGRPDWLGLSAVSNPRAPLSHYHRFDTWIQPDERSDCTRSGCHAPLPHSKHKETRAFLNMHATSIHCGVCHMRSDAKPLDLTWYDLERGAPRGAPALLVAADWLASHRARPRERGYSEQDQARIVGLLREAASAGGDEPGLRRAADALHAVRFSSDAFRSLLGEADAAVSRAFRGSYGAKLALRDAAGKPVLAHPNSRAAVSRLLNQRQGASPEAREQMIRDAHPAQREATLLCSACHRPEGSLLDWKAAGYPQARIDALREGDIFRMIEQISTGVPFELPLASQPGESDH